MAIVNDGYARHLERKNKCTELLQSLIPADKLLAEVKKELNTCLAEYKAKTKEQWQIGLYGMDQQFTANTDAKTATATVGSDKKVSIVTSCPKRSLVLYHGFETAGQPIPFKNTKFEIYEAYWEPWPDSVKNNIEDDINTIGETFDEYVSATKGIRRRGEAIRITTSGEITNKLNPSNPNQLDENGMAEIEGLDGTKEYMVIFSPNITEKDFETLYASYDEVIKKFNGILTAFWSKPDPETQNKTQEQQYADFYTSVADGSYDGTDINENLNALFKGLLEGLYALWCGLRDIALWVTNPVKQYETVSNIVQNREIIQQQLEKEMENLDRVLSIFKDEAFMFIVIKSILCYFKLLTPQQCHTLLSNGFGQALPQIIISIFLPAAKVDVLLEVAMNVGSTEKNKAEYKSTQTYLNNLGDNAYGK